MRAKSYLIFLVFFGLSLAISSIFTCRAFSLETSSDNSPAALSGGTKAASSGGQGGGSGADNFIFTGAATYSIPIEVPPGRAGVTPQISILYNSQKGDGWIGVGWDLDMGSIQRNTKDGLDYGGNDFVYTKNGSSSALTYISSINEYRAKIDDGSFIKFTYNSTSWVAYDKSGMMYYLGSDSTSRQSDPSNPAKVFKWALDKVQDTNGNYMSITYKRDAEQLYVQEIDYTGNGTALSPTNKVVFNMIARNDSFPSFLTNFSITTGLRLDRIDTFSSDRYGNSLPAGSYRFQYDYSPLTSRSVLKSVQRIGDDGSSTLPQTTFLSNIDTGGSSAFLHIEGNQGPAGLVRSDKDHALRDLDRFKEGDFNGDGKMDFLYISYTSSISSGIYLATGTGFTFYPLPFSYYADHLLNCDDYYINRFVLGDFNGDGKTDILLVDRDHYSVTTLGNGLCDIERISYGTSKLFLSNVDQQTGAFSLVEAPAPHFTDYFPTGIPGFMCALPGQREMWEYAQCNDGYTSRFKTGDFNGDGKTDILYIEGGYGITAQSGIYEATGDGNNISLVKSPSVSLSLPESFKNNQVRLGDFNGDGKVDIHL